MLLALLVILLIAEIALSFDKSKHYRNVTSVGAAGIVCLLQLVAEIAVEVTATYVTDLYLMGLVAQAVIIIASKLHTVKRDKYVKYGVPREYTEGWRSRLISAFYDFAENSVTVHAKPMTVYIGYVLFFCSLILTAFIGVQTNLFGTSGNLLSPTLSMFGLASFLLEFSIFCNSDSLWKKLRELYEQKAGCTTRRAIAKARYSNVEDYKYIFVKNHVWEDLHITQATKINWKSESDTVKGSITYYNFSDKSVEEVSVQGAHPALEEFITQNSLEPNSMYVTAYNLIADGQNVLIKTPSYVDFEPYFIALMKIKIAKTKKTVFVVSSEDKKATTIIKLRRAFEEYFGFENIPVICSIDEYADKLRESTTVEQRQFAEKNRFSHLKKVVEADRDKSDDLNIPPVKEADVLIATPEDVCDPSLVEIVRSTIKDLGLIVYYDFSDCVQEQALFARIIHTVLDYDDKVSTLYMTDGFFDLEQVLDNFFSKRNLYRIEVPRKPSKHSYVTGWKAENAHEMQSRTYPDASRNIGNHIPILYDGSSHTMNDFMVVEDEYDTYAENYSNFSGDPMASRLDCHVGWTDVMGGNSVYCTVSDTYNNAAHAYRAMCGVGEESEYINIISRPYLLRNYLMYHLRYFTQHPGVLSTYSPGVIKTPRAIAYEACVKAHIAGCTVEQLVKYVEDASIKVEQTPESMLQALVNMAFGDKLEINEIFTDVFDRYYIDASTYGKIIDKSGFAEKIHFVNNHKLILRNKREYPCLIPQQKIVLNGVKYTVERVEGNRVEITDSNLREPVFVNRAVRTCDLKVNSLETFATHVQHGTNSKLVFERLVCDAEVVTHGNIVFKDSYHPLSDKCRFVYSEPKEKDINQYSDVNVFRIKLSNPMINSANAHKLAHLMAILLNEMMPTFFPRYSERIIVGCSGWEIDPELECERVSALHIATQMNVSGDGELEENELCLYVLEDASLETGLVNVFWQDEEFRYMLKIMEDYLYFQEMIRREEFADIFSADYKASLHLLRKILLQIINDTLDVDDALYFNTIRRSRNKFNDLEYHKFFNMTCDFCGKPIYENSGQPLKYHFYAYSGKVSCVGCYAKAVCSEKYDHATIAAFEEQINTWFYKRYDDRVAHAFYNNLEDAEFLADEFKAHNRYIVTDDCDREGVAGLSYSGTQGYGGLSVGVNDEYIPAVIEGWGIEDRDDIIRAGYLVSDNGYPYILIENGLNYGEYMGTLCHEMTHHWQYDNIDFALATSNAPGNIVNEFGMAVDLSNMRIEGHAEWERIQYLKRKISWFLGQREADMLRVRLDSYGRGFLWMEKMMRVGGDDPRIPVNRTLWFIIKRTWYQITNNSFAIMKLYLGNGKSSDTAVPDSGESDTPDTESET